MPHNSTTLAMIGKQLIPIQKRWKICILRKEIYSKYMHHAIVAGSFYWHRMPIKISKIYNKTTRQHNTTQHSTTHNFFFRVPLKSLEHFQIFSPSFLENSTYEYGSGMFSEKTLNGKIHNQIRHHWYHSSYIYSIYSMLALLISISCFLSILDLLRSWEWESLCESVNFWKRQTWLLWNAHSPHFLIKLYFIFSFMW